MFGRTKKLEKRIKQLECEIRTGHKLIYTRETQSEFLSIFAPTSYAFRCILCDFIIYKYEFQLTKLERSYLEHAGILDTIPMPNCKAPKASPIKDLDIQYT